MTQTTDTWTAERKELAATIARKAQAIADGTVVGSQWGLVHSLQELVEMLAAWTPDDRTA